jgi:hypothetical protein
MFPALSIVASAQTPPQYQTTPSYQEPAPQQAVRWSQQELSNLVAPIALYPDLLLSEVLAASTYPLELVQAGQWMQGNPNLRGADLVNAAKQQNWDPSVQALVAFPDVMNLLTRDIQWTTGLGNAFLAQQGDVMDAIQQLRASARANGRLTDTPQQRVTVDQGNGQSAIVIQPTDPQMVYPPVYNPEYVWGPPVYGAYPPLLYPAPGYGISYAVGTFLGGLFTGLLTFGGWGWGLSWLTHGLFLNGLFFSHFGFHGFGGNGYYAGRGWGGGHVAWVHDPGHRLGVPYGNHFAGARFSNSYARPSFNSYGNRQADAYRGLTSRGSSARGSAARSFTGRESGNFESSRGFSNSRNYSASAPREAFASRGGSNDRNLSRSFSAPHSSARESSNHFGGGGHSESHAHSGGGGHSGGHGHSSGGGGHSHSSSHHK